MIGHVNKTRWSRDWEAFAGDRDDRFYQRRSVTPFHGPDDPGRGSDFDLFRTRTAAAQAIAYDHDADLAPDR